MATRHITGLVKQQSPFFALLFVNIVMFTLWQRDIDVLNRLSSTRGEARRGTPEEQLVDQFMFGNTHDGQGHQHHHQRVAEASQRNSTDSVSATVATYSDSIGTASCEVCISNPEDPLCEYGIDNIRLSRTYQGSGHRVRQLLAKADAGQPIRIGVSATGKAFAILLTHLSLRLSEDPFRQAEASLAETNGLSVSSSNSDETFLNPL